MSVTTAKPILAATGDAEIFSEERDIRHRAIRIAFYAYMVVISIQVSLTIIEIVWGRSQDGGLPTEIWVLAVLVSIPWACNVVAISLGASNVTLAKVRTDAVFCVSLIATVIGTYKLGVNAQIASFGIYCGTIATLRAGQWNGNVRVGCLAIGAMVALAARPGGLSDAGLMSVIAVNDSLTGNRYAPLLQPYTLGIMINYAIDFLMRSYQRNRRQLLRAYEELSNRWERDTLTGVFSRATVDAKFKAMVDAGSAEDSRLAVALIDLDNFKSINTFCGHGAGDRALLAFAERLQATLPDADLFRLGGDEFLALQSITGDLEPLLDQLKAAICPLKIAYHNDELNLSASVGVTLVAGTCDYQKAASEADIAMRQAKRQGKGSLVRFEAGHSVPSASITERPAIALSPFTSGASKTEMPAREVGAAILSNQVGYAVQPFFDIRSGRISGAECLLRWRLADGSIVPIDHYLNTFIALEWQAPYLAHLLKIKEQLFSTIRAEKPISVHFNYTAEVLSSDAFLSLFIEPLKEKAVDLRGFVIEISEKGSQHFGPIIEGQRLATLRDAGIKIAIDDFGVGHSNLERMANVDADIVKLDKHLVARGTQSKRGLQILRHARQLTESLNINLIAEGVETAEQEATLARVGITEHQGFFRGRASSLEEFLVKLRQQKLREHEVEA